MQPIHNMDFRQRLLRPAAQLVEDLIEGHRVRIGIARTKTRERAEEAARRTHVRRLEPEVEVVVRPAPVTPLAFAVGEPADGVQIRTTEEADPLVESQALARVDFLEDVR